MISTSSWFSLHITFHHSVYSKRFDCLLAEVVHPLMKFLLNEGFVERYFFIRYAEKGPHIRLRLQGKKDILESELYNCIEETITEFFSRNSPIVDINQYRSILKDLNPFELYPSNTIQKIDYIPETSRFGGEYSLAIIEEAFYRSSEAVLEILSLTWKLPSPVRLGIGMQMMLILLDIFISTDRTKTFARNLCRAYLDAEIGFVSSSLWGEEERLHEFMKESYKMLDTPLPVLSILKAFESKFSKNVLVTQSFLENFKNQVPNSIFLPLSIWKLHLQKTYEDLCNLADHGQLHLSNFQKLSLESQLTALAANLVHLNSNRLGLHLIEEAWLAYILWRSFDENK